MGLNLQPIKIVPKTASLDKDNGQINIPFYNRLFTEACGYAGHMILKSRVPGNMRMSRYIFDGLL